MHEGTVDGEEILRWSRLLARICDTAMSRTEQSLLEEGAGLTDTVSRFPALERVAAGTRDAAFCKWLHKRLVKNRKAALEGMSRKSCPRCAHGGIVVLEAAMDIYREQGYTEWCQCRDCGCRFHWGPQRGAVSRD